MWKQFVALARGRSYEAAEAVADRNALVILRQQIRESAGAVDGARRAVAVAIARNREEEKRAAALRSQIADLEARALAALEQDKGELAREAAEAIAMLEREEAHSRQALACFALEIERHRRAVAGAERRLADLKSGQRLAAVSDSVGRLGRTAPASLSATLTDAEATLSRLRERQGEAEAAELALDELSREGSPQAIGEKLAAAGCGAPAPHTTDAVLARLQARHAAN